MLEAEEWFVCLFISQYIFSLVSVYILYEMWLGSAGATCSPLLKLLGLHTDYCFLSRDLLSIMIHYSLN